MKFKKIIAGILAFAITVVFLPKTNFENYVKAYISSDNFNLHTYMADNILCDGTIANRRLGFYLNDAKPMAEIWLDSVTPTFKSAVSAWENVNLALSPDDIPSKAIEAKGYYMTVILSMIQASYEGDHVVDKLVNADIKEASTLYNGFAKLFKEMSNADIDSYLSKGSFTDDEVALLNAVQKKFLEDNKFLSAGKTASDIIDMVNLAKKPTEYVDKFIQYCNVYEISNEWKECLQEMYNKSPKDGSPLCQALETLIYASQDINNSVYQIWADGFEEITNEFYKFAVKELTKAITDCCPLVKGMKIGQTIGKSISNLLFSTDKTIEEYYVITAYCQVADLFKSVFDDKINQYKNNKTTDNAKKFLTYLDMYFQVFITGNEFGQDFTNVMYTGGIVTYIARSRDEYENFIEFTKDSTKTAIAAHEHITTSWLDYLYNDNLEMYEVFAAALGDSANTYISVTRVEFEKEAVEWGIQDFDHTGYKCMVYPENATNKDLIYTSSDSSVAEITNEGVLRLNSTGTCVITARAVDNNETIYDTLSVTVIQEGGADSRKQTIFPFTEEVPKPSEEVPKPSNGDFSYSLTNDGTIRITGYTGNETSITIPNDIDGYKVTEIGAYAFKYSSLTSIIIPKTLTSASYGSLGSSSITSVVFEEGIENIPAYICSRATALESVSIPDSVTSIGNYAFENCESLTSVELPASVTSIGNYAFHNSVCLESITLGSVQSMGYAVFNGCKSLTSLIIPKTLTNPSSEHSLAGSSITSVVFEEGIKNIPAYICGGATALVSVTIPDSVTSIDDSAFFHCKNLTSVKLPISVTSIGDTAFNGCESLTSVELPTSVTSIGNYVFQNCVCLESITLGGVQSMGYAVFNGCKSLTNLIIPKTLTSAARNSSFYGSLGSSCITSVVFEEGIKNIPADICSRAKLLASVTIPDSVTSIDDSAFFECESLTSVELPASVTNIGGYAFSHCEKLSSIKIGSSVKKIGSGAFSGCESLTSVELPTSVTSIGNSAFNDCVCLKSITLGGVQSMGPFVFDGCKSLTSLIIPKTLTSANYYLSCGPLGGSSITSVVFEEGIKNIPDYICIGATALESVTIPDSVTSIGNCAFINCESLTSVELPASVTNINDYAFENCICLKSITLGGVQSMGCKVFNGCKSLTSLIIPKTLTNPSSEHSLAGSSITSVVFEEGIKNIPAYICGGATALVSVTIPDSVTSIDDSAFFHCKNLTSVKLPISVTSIGDTAFNGCESLTSVELPASVTSIGWSAFAGCNSLLTFYGIDGSYAQKYANTHSIKFVAMDNKALFDIETKIIVTGHDLENITLTVTKDEASSTPDSIAYNITLTDSSGFEIQPTENVTVKIPVPNGWNGTECKVYRKETNGKYTDMNATYKDNYMVFNTDHFSEYIVTKEKLISDYTLGDINSDGKINTADARWVLQCASGKRTLTDSQKAAADVNKDGKVNTADAKWLLQVASGKRQIG